MGLITGLFKRNKNDKEKFDSFKKLPVFREMKYPDSASDESVLEIPIYIKSQEIKDLILQSIPDPLLTGRTEEISVKLLGKDEKLVTKYVEKVIRPFIKEHYITLYREIKIAVKEIFKNWYKPWKWRKAVRIVWKTILQPYQQFVPAVKEIVKLIPETVVEILDIVIGTSVWFDYTVRITDFDINVNGPDFYIKVKMDIDLSMDIRKTLLKIGPKVTINNLLSSTSKAEISSSGKIIIDENITPVLLLNKDNFELKFTQFILPGAVESFDLLKILHPKFLVLESIVGKIINNILAKIINKKLNERINEELEGKSGFDYLNELARSCSGPFSLGDDFWLKFNITKIFYSDILPYPGDTHKGCMFKLGLQMRPSILFQSAEPTLDDYTDFLPIEKNNFIPHSCLFIDIMVESIDFKIKLNKKLQEIFKIESDYIVTLLNYSIESDQLIFTVNFGVSNNKSRQFHVKYKARINYDYLFNAFFLSKIKIIEQDTHGLDNIANNNLLLFNENNTLILLDDETPLLRDKLQNICIDFKYGHFNGAFNTVEFINISMQNDYIVVMIKITGSMYVSINASNSQYFISKECLAYLSSMSSYQQSEIPWPNPDNYIKSLNAEKNLIQIDMDSQIIVDTKIQDTNLPIKYITREGSVMEKMNYIKHTLNTNTLLLPHTGKDLSLVKIEGLNNKLFIEGAYPKM